MSTSTPTSAPAPAPAPPTTDTNETPLPFDPWTPDQELVLLKALIKFKPVGLHAHFRMFSIHHALQTSGTCTAEDTHTHIPGIWAKLRTLYDLDRLDEREDTVITAPSATVIADEDEDEDDGDGATGTSGADGGRGQGEEEGAEYWRDFELPRDDGMGRDFERLMWERRLAPEGTPGSPERGTRGRRESTVAGTDEPRSSPIAGGGSRGTRRRRGRVARLREGMEGTGSGGGGSRVGSSKAASETGGKDEDGDGDEVMEDAGDEEDGSSSGGSGGDDGDEDAGTSEEPEEDEKRVAPRRGRGRGRGGRGRRGGRRRG